MVLDLIVEFVASTRLLLNNTKSSKVPHNGGGRAESEEPGSSSISAEHKLCHLGSVPNISVSWLSRTRDWIGDIIETLQIWTCMKIIYELM